MTAQTARRLRQGASHRGFKRKDDDNGTPPERNPEVDFECQQRCNDTHASTTNVDARNEWATPGTDKGDNSKAFIKGCRKPKVTMHVAAKDKHPAVDARFTRHGATKPA